MFTITRMITRYGNGMAGNGMAMENPKLHHLGCVFVHNSPIQQSIYHLVMTCYDIHSSPWKDPPIFKFGVYHLFRLGPSIPWRTVGHNQVG